MEDFAHQTTDFEIAKNRKYYGLLWEQGCGKTRNAIKLAENHFKEGRITACMVITTKGLVRNWSDVELPKHASIPYDYDVWPNRQVTNTKNLYYWLVNIDALLTDGYVKRIKEFMKTYPDFMTIIDESTVIKNPSAKRTRRAWRVGLLSKVRLIMTGLPTPHSPLDLYAQCKFLDINALGFKDFAAFKYRHADIVMVLLGQRAIPKIDGYKNLGELKEKLSKFTSIIRKDECLSLPPTRQRIFPVPLTKEQRKYYDELRQEMITIIDKEVIDASNVISMINKCLQLCSGQIKLKDGKYLDVPTDRLDVLEELVEECPGQTIVWTAFVHNATAIGKRFGKRAILLPSGLQLDDRQDLLARFQAGEGKILVANPASAGHGLTLVNCSNAIYYSRSYNFEHRSQADARIHRIGQTEACLYTDLCDPTTMEKNVIEVLLTRQGMSEFMLDRNFLRQMWDVKQEEYA
jgi:SNF2 family DNA or RNA helicase